MGTALPLGRLRCNGRRGPSRKARLALDAFDNALGLPPGRTWPVTASDITVGQVAERVRVLEVKCARCDRGGRLSPSRLLLELGANAPIRQAWEGLNADCPRRRVHQGAGEACSLHAPILSKLFLPP